MGTGVSRFSELPNSKYFWFTEYFPPKLKLLNRISSNRENSRISEYFAADWKTH